MRPTNAMTILLMISFATAVVADVTLLQILPTASNTPIVSQQLSISAVGVDSGGSTTYVAQVIEGLVVYTDPATTITINSVPTTFTYTLVENKSGARYSHSDSLGVAVASCAFGADGKGSCTGEIKASDTTIQYTTTGSVAPYVTLKGPGPTAIAAPNEARTLLHHASSLAVVFFFTVYLLLHMAA
ncbi:hypothetical protein BD779DRAFT_225421 [Infundibulicybe gibba]|nr:hypothetical protein BD779DRAFT_225421 [Infundibulicybe gibba]